MQQQRKYQLFVREPYQFGMLHVIIILKMEIALVVIIGNVLCTILWTLLSLGIL
jgi:hypothetical protein